MSNLEITCWAGTAESPCRYSAVAPVPALFRRCLRITSVTRGTSSFTPVLSFLATDILTNSSLSCELAIHDLIGINVHSTVLRKIRWLVCAISLFHSFVFSPGVVARRQDETAPSEKTK